MSIPIWAAVLFALLAAVGVAAFAVSAAPRAPVIDRIVVRDHARAFPACVLPLHLENGVFLARLRVGGQDVRACIDTGSQYLIVSGGECSTCSGEYGRYFPHKSASSRRAYSANLSEVRFGTQQERIRWHTDTVDFLTSAGSVHIAREQVPNEAVRIERVTFGAIAEHAGATSYNVLGLSFSQENKPPPFLEEVLHSDHDVKAFTLMMRATHGALALGDPTPLRHLYGPRVGTLPLLRNPRSIGVPYDFYMTPISNLYVGEDPENSVFRDGYALWDTGSNYCCMSQASMKRLRELGVGTDDPTTAGPPTTLMTLQDGVAR